MCVCVCVCLSAALNILSFSSTDKHEANGNTTIPPFPDGTQMVLFGKVFKDFFFIKSFSEMRVNKTQIIYVRHHSIEISLTKNS